MMSLRAQAMIADMKPCAFCVWHSHDFPADDEHERLHEVGYHTCGVDGGFRDTRPDCQYFALQSGADANF